MGGGGSQGGGEGVGESGSRESGSRGVGSRENEGGGRPCGRRPRRDANLRARLASYIGRTVSRVIAVVLVLVFGCDAVCPALFANPEPTLPACCRRAGKHHCMMAASGVAESGVVLKTVQERCPYFPKNAPGIGGNYCAPPPSGSVIAPIFSHPTAKPQTEARYRVSLLRGWQKRGPPFLD
jgi:hypothetical protein